MASNLWIDRVRRRRTEQAVLGAERDDPTRLRESGADAVASAAVGDAGAVLMQQLSPQERAALVLKDVFDLSLEETASVLETSIGAVKAALHRGRGRLKDPEDTPSARNRPTKEVVDRFVDLYNARDLPGLLALLLDDASIAMPGHVLEIGRAGFERDNGWLHHNFYNPMDGTPSTARWTGAEFEGERIVLVFGDHEGGRVVASVMRVEELEGRIARVRVYALCPDVVDEVAAKLGLPTGPQRFYRFPFRMAT